ncbi:MAG: hypothetical protein ABH834_01330 [Candidatus Altiarchaeota archaeon]
MDDAGKIKKLLDETGFAAGVELGECMMPSIRRGDTLFIEKASCVDVIVGEVIVFRRAGKVYAHRVFGKVKVRGMFVLITRGDCEEAFDQPVSEGIFLGRLVCGEKRVRETPKPVIYALLAVYYMNKAVGWRAPLYRVFSSLAGRLIGR